LYVEDLAVPKQRTSATATDLNPHAVADHFDRCADRGIGPQRCGRIWLQTHSGDSRLPSGAELRAFSHAFGDCDWAVMMIIARSGASHALLRFAAGPGGSMVIPVRVDWERFAQDLMDREGRMDQLIGSWLNEYGTAIHLTELDRSIKREQKVYRRSRVCRLRTSA
jgi:hypothetical protein